jgi:SNF2 family DNA or RNA helicase
VNPGLLGSAEAFKERYAVPIERHRNELVAARLRRRTRPLVLRRLKTDPAVVPDLPDKVEMTVHCPLTVEQAALYSAVVRDTLQRLSTRRDAGRRGAVLASLSKLKQVCDHPALFLKDSSRIDGRSGKVARLEEILDEVLAAGERALLFTQFSSFGALLQPHLQRRLGEEVIFLHGGTPRTEREELVRRFQADGGPPVFLLSLRAGGTGLNLTAANHVVHLDRWWNPAAEDQATDRAFRIGQRRDVQVRRLVCAGTIEERIDDIVTGKRRIARLAVTAGESRLTSLTELPDHELAELIALTQEGVALEDD